MQLFPQNGFSLVLEPQPLNLVDLILILIFQIGHFSAARFLYLFKLLLEALGHRFKRLYLTLELRLFISVLRDDLLEFLYLVFENIHFTLGVLDIFIIFLFLVEHLLFEVLVFLFVLLDTLHILFNNSGFILVLSIEFRNIKKTGSSLSQLLFKLSFTFYISLIT